MIRTTLLLSVLPFAALASFCGETAIPFSFQALRKGGQPVLGCARPACFGRTREGTRVKNAKPALFYRINGKEDGYVRRSDAAQVPPPTSAGTHSTRYIPQTSKCEENYRVGGCAEDEWLGGIAPSSDFDTSQELQLRCCRYAPLKNSEDRGIATVRAGQLVIGGESNEPEQPLAFDYISNIVKHRHDNGTIWYNIHMRRYTCTSNIADFEVKNSEKASVVVPIADSEPEEETPAPEDDESAASNLLPSREVNGAPQPSPATFIPSTGPLPAPPQQQQHELQQQQQQQFQPRAAAAVQQPLAPQPVPQQPFQQVQQPQVALPVQFQPQSQSQGPYPPVQPQQFSNGPTPLGGAPQPLPVAPGSLPSPQQPGVLTPQPGLLSGLPRLGDMPKLPHIPSIEEVESSMTPEQRRFITNLAHFFGVI